MYAKLTNWTKRDGTRGAARRRGLMAARDFDALECRTLLSLAIVKDVNTVDSAPANITLDNGNVFYTTHDPAGGLDLQMTTTSGTTTLLKNFSTPGPYGGASISNLTAVGAKLFFSATSSDGTELWSTDGTTQNTTEVKDIAPGTKSSNPAHLTAFNGSLYFTADATGKNNPIAWVSDGTPGGTTPFNDASNTPIPSVQQFVASGASLVFTDGNKLFVSDGISASANTTSIAFNGNISGLTPVGPSVFFAASANNGDGTELWEETNGAVTEVKDIFPGATGSYPSNLTNVNGKLFFTARDNTDGRELWTSDGTTANTKLVKDIFSGAMGSYPSNLTAVGGKLFFSASDGSGSSTSGLELWVTDGTTLTTSRLKDIDPAAANYYKDNFTASNGLLYFSNNDGTNGQELWTSDGTAANTKLVQDINPGAASSFPSDLTNINGTLYFSAHDNLGGNQLWKSGGTAATTTKVQTFNPAATQGGANLLNTLNDATLGNTLLFPANDGALGTELYKSDGTAAGTTLIKDIVPGLAGSYPYLMTTAGAQAFFVANTPRGSTTAEQLWVTDGTAANTKVVIGFPTFSISNLKAVGSKLFFTAFDSTHGTELWVTDGTPLNTKVIDINPGTGGSYPSDLTAFNGKLYFSARDGTTGQELWTSDGTGVGTTLVKDIRPGATGSNPYNLTVFGNNLFFTANDGNSINEIWESDGTPGGTTLFTTLTKASVETIGNLTVSGTSMFFTANDGTNTGALWVTDGTASNTVVVSDIAPLQSVFSTSMHALVSLNNGKVVFAANDGTDGQEPWVSDGTSSGTMLLRDINQGNLNSISYTNALLVNGKVYFGATDGTHGTELWQTDGTMAGTVMTQDINPGGFSSNPVPLGALNGRLVVAADDGTHGTELLIDLPPTLTTIPNQNATPGNTVSFTAQGAASAPGVSVTYSLGAGAPSGATINPNTGAFSWAVPAGQAMGNVPVTVIVTENTPAMQSASQVVTIAIGSSNHAPTLAAITSPQNVGQGGTLTVTAVGSDQDAGQTLTYSLSPGTSGATINSFSGVITWNVPASQTVGDYPVSVTVTDNGNPPLSSAPQTFTIHVSAASSNHAPTLATITSPQNANQGATFTVTAVGSDQDAGQTLTYSLSPGTTGATINSSTGVVTWAVPANQAIGDYPVSVMVTDNGTPPLSSAPQNFTIHVSAASTNHAPTLAAIAAQTVNEGTQVMATAVGSDQDAGQTLTYSLTGTVPAGASINPQTGVITYTPLVGPATANIMVLVTDNGSPALSSAAQTFTVTVNNVTPTVGFTSGASARQNIAFSSGGTFTDPGVQNWTATVNYGDGSGTQNLALSGKTFALAHTYTFPGNYTITVGVNDGTATGSNTEVLNVRADALGDFTGSGVSQVAVYGPDATNSFRRLALTPPGGGATTFTPFGSLQDVFVPGDYSGTGKTSIAVYGPDVSGTFNRFAITQPDGSVKITPFGSIFDLPVVGDFNGDGKTDLAVYGPDGTGHFNQLKVLQPDGTVKFTSFGGLQDQFVPGNFNNDGHTDIAVYGPDATDSFNRLAVLQNDGTVQVTPFGGLQDKFVAGNFLGTGITSIAVYGPDATNSFHRLAVRQPDGSAKVTPFGGLLDVFVVGDFTGDGITRVVTYGLDATASFRRLAQLQSSGAVVFTPFGGLIDQEVGQTPAPKVALTVAGYLASIGRTSGLETAPAVTVAPTTTTTTTPAAITVTPPSKATAAPAVAPRRLPAQAAPAPSSATLHDLALATVASRSDTLGDKELDWLS